ncbi:hypothetical protein C8Q80DRAFT_303571 [Daedaleopsis nitida]|nr:hypothetical protein C8Q80DRAFT_303571 [Daedaleopsis nitida]
MAARRHRLYTWKAFLHFKTLKSWEAVPRWPSGSALCRIFDCDLGNSDRLERRLRRIVRQFRAGGGKHSFSLLFATFGTGAPMRGDVMETPRLNVDLYPSIIRTSPCLSDQDRDHSGTFVQRAPSNDSANLLSSRS